MEVHHNTQETFVYHPQGIGMFKRGNCIVKGQIDRYSAVGKAIVKYFQESYYRGECKDNCYEGVGTLITPRLPFQLHQTIPLKLPQDSLNTHQGTFIQGLKEGFGVTSWEGGYLQSTWSAGIPGGYTKGENGEEKFEGLVQGQSCVGRLTTSQGKYHGQFKRGLKSGVGIWKGEKICYIGEWNEGVPDGCGEEFREDGVKQEGQWKSGKLEGVGRIQITAPSSNNILISSYIGQLKNEEKDGFGRLEEDNTIYEGYWLAGQKQGLGFLSIQGGNTYFGEWEYNNRSGIGYSYSPSFSYVGEWREDKPSGVGFVTFEGKKEILVSIEKGVVKGQLSDDLVPSYKNRFKALKFDEFKQQSRETLHSLQREIDVPLEKVKKVFKNLHLDFSQEKEKAEKTYERLESSIAGIDNSIRDIEAFLDKRCTGTNVQPLQISCNLHHEDHINVVRSDSEPFQQPKSISPVPLRGDSSLSPSQKKHAKPWLPTNAKPSYTKQFSKLDDFAKHFSKHAGPKKRNEEIIDKAAGELPKRSRSDLENMKEQLKKQINKVEIKETEVAKEALHVRRKETILKEFEEDLLRRERELELKAKQLSLEKLELEEEKINIVASPIQKQQENMKPEQNEESIHSYEAIHRQKEILKQIEGMIKIENDKLIAVKHQLKETSQKLSTKKEENIMAKAKKTSNQKTTQTDPLITKSDEQHIMQGMNSDGPLPQKTENKTKTHEESPAVDMSLVLLTLFSYAGSPHSIPAHQDPDSGKEEDEEEYFDQLHRKTNLRASDLVNIPHEQEHKDMDPDIYKERIAELEETNTKQVQHIGSLTKELDKIKEELKRWQSTSERSPSSENPEHLKLKAELEEKTKNLKISTDSLKKTKEELDQIKNTHDSEKKEHGKTKEELKKIKEELESLKNPPGKPKNYVSVANSAISDKKNEPKQEPKETVGLSPFQSNNALIKKEELSKEQAEALMVAEESFRSLELKNEYLEDQLAKARIKEQKLTRLVLDYTKGINDWLNLLQNPDTATTSTPEALAQILIENDQALLESFPKSLPAKTVTKPPSSNLY